MSSIQTPLKAFLFIVTEKSILVSIRMLLTDEVFVNEIERARKGENPGELPLIFSYFLGKLSDIVVYPLIFSHFHIKLISKPELILYLRKGLFFLL